MKMIIKENEAGFLMKNGVFVKMLFAGKHYVANALGYELFVEAMEDEVEFLEVPYQVLANNEDFAKRTVRYQIPDGQLGLIYVDGKLCSCATRKEYVFWNVFETYEIRLISMEEPEIGAEVTKQMLDVIPTKYYTMVEVGRGQAGLLYFDNVLQRTLPGGLYRFWTYGVKVTAHVIDMKQTELNVVGQEILTKDKIGIRMNVTCTYKVKDPVAMTENMKNMEQQLYSAVQLTVRELTGNYRLDEILEQKETISKEVFAKLQEKAPEFYVEILTAGIRDIILPGEIRDIMNSVLVAEKNAQANVIARREEVASTRSLLNTAKLMEENKTLYRLKELEYMERICDKVGEISVGGNAGLVEQLGVLMGAR